MAMLGLFSPGRALGQFNNFEPLRSQDVVEEKEQWNLAKGLEVSGVYAAQFLRDKAQPLTAEGQQTWFWQDFRLRLRTTAHERVQLNVVLEPRPGAFSSEILRRKSFFKSTEKQDSFSLNAKAAYLAYQLNPRSEVQMGKVETLPGDPTGRVFYGHAPGINFSCFMGTWCMPFGGFKLGEHSREWTYHWAASYQVWQETDELGRENSFGFRAFRVIYSENNVPLRRDLGPGYHPNPEDATLAPPSQFQDGAGNALYYHSDQHDYYGVRLDWKSHGFHLNADLIYSQGKRRIQAKAAGNPFAAAAVTLDGVAQDQVEQKIGGQTRQLEMGYQGVKMGGGLRYMRATGNKAYPLNDPGRLRTIDKSYHEITPGSYRGTRLYFNGGNNGIDGGGLGHSVANTTVTGIFFHYEDREESEMAYRLGIYDLQKTQAVYDHQGDLQKNIGLEVDNMLAFFLEPYAQLQFEINLIQLGKAFTIEDGTVPGPQNKNLFQQGVVRFLYAF